MRIESYKGLHVLLETRNGITTVYASSWDKEELKKLMETARTENINEKLK